MKLTKKRQLFLSTLSLRRATDLATVDIEVIGGISIHALLAESDQATYCCADSCNDFYPRSPCGERRATAYPILPMGVFLSTLSLRRATQHWQRGELVKRFLSTLSLRRATILGNPCAGCPAISIHALLAESDKNINRGAYHIKRFLSTLSLRRATPRGGGLYYLTPNFYPRSPCGERQLTNAHNSPNNQISIHALLAESDYQGQAGSAGCLHFYPRSPCGERRFRYFYIIKIT